MMCCGFKGITHMSDVNSEKKCMKDQRFIIIYKPLYLLVFLSKVQVQLQMRTVNLVPHNNPQGHGRA